MSEQISIKPLCLLESVYWNFVEAVCVCVYQGYWHVIFSWLPCLVLVLTWVAVLKWVECSPLFLIFLGGRGGKNLRRVEINSLNVRWNSPTKPSCPGVLFIGRFWIIDSVLLLMIGMFISSISLWLSHSGLYISRNLSTSLRFKPLSLSNLLKKRN